jgi:tektin-1
MNQISAISNKIMHIKRSIADKEGYMALAHARLNRRCQRPGMELTQDLVEINLIKEIHELRNIVANLQQMLCEVRALLHDFINLNIYLSSE